MGNIRLIITRVMTFLKGNFWKPHKKPCPYDFFKDGMYK